jgi:hypothetical protein
MVDTLVIPYAQPTKAIIPLQNKTLTLCRAGQKTTNQALTISTQNRS